jgi:hypothetical protein
MDEEGVDKIVEELRELRSVLNRIESNTGFFPRIIEFVGVALVMGVLVVIWIVASK